MGTNPNYLGPFRNRLPLNLYRKLPLVNSLSLNQSETVFKIKFEALHFELMIPKHQQINIWMNMSEMPEKKKARLRYDNVFKTAWTDEFHFIKHSWKGNKFAFCEFCRTETESTILHPSEKNSFFHGFIILYLKFWLHRFYIQNAAECTILHPSEKKRLPYRF
jgi:hypothetical protein